MSWLILGVISFLYGGLGYFGIACSECGKEITKDATVCPLCSSELK